MTFIRGDGIMKIHLLSNRTGTAHRSAARPIIEVENSEYGSGFQEMQVVGNLLVVLRSNRYMEKAILRIFDWTSGSILKVIFVASICTHTTLLLSFTR